MQLESALDFGYHIEWECLVRYMGSITSFVLCHILCRSAVGKGLMGLGKPINFQRWVLEFTIFKEFL